MAHRYGTEERREEIFRDALGLIAREYASPLTLDVAARRLATSRRQLQRVFGERGTSFREVLHGVRMLRARELLAEPISICAVAASVGYAEPSQFSKKFRSAHGVSPRQFRRAVSDGGRPQTIAA